MQKLISAADRLDPESLALSNAKRHHGPHDFTDGVKMIRSISTSIKRSDEPFKLLSLYTLEVSLLFHPGIKNITRATPRY
jgi:hypothetical protein